MWNVFLPMIIGFIIIVVSVYVYKNKMNIKRYRYINNNPNANNFYNNNYQYIEQMMNQVEPLRMRYYLRVKTYFIMMIIGLGAVLFAVFGIPMMSGTLPSSLLWIIGITCGIVFIVGLIFTEKYERTNSEYEALYKNSNIIPKVISAYNPNLSYRVSDGYTKEEYDNCHFFDGEDLYSSGDGITDNRTGFFCANVRSAVRVEDAQGHNTNEVVIFWGSLARIPIPNSNCEILFGGIKNKGVSKDINNIQFFPVKFEDDIFNRLFDVFASDKVEAYKIITPDVIEQLVYLKQNVFGDIEIRIKNDYLYVRFKTGDDFVPSLLNPKKEVSSVVTSIAIINEVINATYNIKSIIERKIES